MSKKKKHQPEDQEVERKPFCFMDTYVFEWTGHEWIIPEFGHWWFGHLLNRIYKFNFDHYDEFGLLKCWVTIDHAEQMIRKCAKWHVFSVDPDPMFLRRWLDSWVELYYCRLWQHTFDTLRLKKGMGEIDAFNRAEVVSSEFEQLFFPTFPRYPKPQKARRGSKKTA